MPYFASTDMSVPLRTGFETAFVHEVAVADFNGDGKLDFALTYFLYPLENRATPIRLFLGDGLGGFTDSTAAVFPGGAPQTVHAREAVVADFNGDGRSDLFIADHGYDANPFPGAQNALVLSSGAGGLLNATSQLPQLSDYSHSAEAADIDGDGDQDIFVGNGGGGTAYVKPYFLINDGHGGFTRSDAGLPASALGGANHWSEAFLDVDGDGDKDLFLGASTNSPAVLLLNNGHGVFTDSGHAMPAGPANADAVDIQSVDINGDGRPDLVANYSVAPTAGNPQRYVQVLINNGAGGFTDETSLRLPASMESGDWSRRVHLVDVNGDGAVDMVLSNGSSTPLYLNDGSGHFVAMPAGTLPGNQYDLYTPADVNGDGVVDFVTWRGLSGGQENLRIDIGQAPATTQAGTAAGEGLMAGAGATTITAGGGDDVLMGGSGSDFLQGGDGNDLIHAGAAFDRTNGNVGDDTVYGGLGDDWVTGGKDQDTLYGEEGNDILNGNLGNDAGDGGAGDDVVRGGQGDDVLNGGAGNDWVTGDLGSDTLTGGTGADTFRAFSGGGDDRITDFHAAEGDRIQLDPGTTYTAAQVGADTVLTFAAGNKMTLADVTLANLPQGWIFGA